MAEKYAGLSPFTFCVNNPIRLVDPNGMDWFETTNEDGSKSVKWNKSTGQNFTDASGKWSNIGKTYSAPMSDGSYANSFQNIVISVGERRNALSTIAESSGLTNLFLSSPFVDDNDKSSVFNASIYQAQNDFIRGSAELSSHIFGTIGTGVTAVGTSVSLIPGAQIIGGGLVGLGKGMTLSSSTIDFAIDITAGNYTKALVGITSNIITGKLGKGTEKMLDSNKLSEIEKNFLDGAANTLFNTIGFGVNELYDRKDKTAR